MKKNHDSSITIEDQKILRTAVILQINSLFFLVT